MSVEPMRTLSVDSDGRGSLEERVSVLESSMATMKTAMETVATNTDEILRVISHGKSVMGFVRKHGGKVLAAAIGAGFFNPAFGKFLSTIFNQ